MNTYEIRITNKDNDSDFSTRETQSTSLGAVDAIIEEAISRTDLEVAFHHNDCYIHIFAASDEGYMYDIYESKEDFENAKDPIDGGQCTSTLSNAIEMALNQVI